MISKTKPRPVLDIFYDSMEFGFIEIYRNEINVDENVIVGIIYIPHNTDPNLFTSFLEERLSLIRIEN